ncbi:flagellar export chaperone FliS [Solimonas flava]|uniref:flagellar export chaperone FliS n=1 Tax=Solimonas flava TaxID=415849 RepID=UPI0005BCC7AA|nr:flagellar export chaperone FliS [Solimonas flava]
MHPASEEAAVSYAAVRQYQDASTSTVSAELSPHRLTAMLFDGALARLATGRGAMARGELAIKLRTMSGALAIVEHLRACLDHQAGGAVARNLDALYDYMLRRLVHANASNDVAAVDEVIGLLRPLREAWDAIGER